MFIQKEMAVSDEYANLGEFAVGVISQSIKEFLSIGKSDNYNPVDLVKKMEPVVLQLEYFKGIHNLSQNYLLSHQSQIFGGPGGSPRFTKKTTPEKIQKRFQNFYKDGFRKHVAKFKLDANTIMKRMGDFDLGDSGFGDFEEIEHLSVYKNIEGFKENAFRAHNSITCFIDGIEKAADNGMNLKDLLNIEGWGSPIESHAKESVWRSDETLLNLIPMITFMYESVVKGDSK